MRPSEKYANVLSVARLCAAACGADIIDENYKINGITLLVVFCITVYFIFSVYTVQYKISENWTVVLEAFCMVGSVLQGISKLMTGIMFKDLFCDQNIFLTAVYKKYEAKGENYTLVLHRCISRVRMALQSVAALYAVVVLTLIAVPFGIWAFTGNRLFVMQFYIPLLDPDTIHGYLITIGMQSTCLVFGGFGNFAGDMFMLVTFSHTVLLVDIFEQKANELNELAIDYGSQKAAEKLRDVLEWHQTYARFIELIDKMYFWVNFTQITTSALSIVLTLVIMFTGNWPGSYAYLCISFSMLYLYCGMGTLIEIANERIVDEVYAIHWYILTVPQQKAIRFMLMKSQSVSEVTVGGVAPLSVSTGLQVTKSVYSVFMMLLNFFD